MSEFIGAAVTINDDDFARAAQKLECEEAVIRAVAEVESGGRTGFLEDGRPKILFESRWFHKLTDGAFDKSHSHISTPRWVRNYRGGAGEFDRLGEAIALDREAALKSASWGMFQILGVNHGVCCFVDVQAFVTAQMAAEGSHLDAFVNFVISNRLDDELRDKRWADFARGYNGPAYAENRYDQKMAEAYVKYAAGRILPTTLEVQQALNRRGANIVADGITGPGTRAAIRTFQAIAGLPINGIAGPATMAALGLTESHDPIALSAVMNG
ncbi:MAG: N-acetylmuramidase domain-containing protein [Pseudomonadota bacterium]